MTNRSIFCLILCFISSFTIAETTKQPMVATEHKIPQYKNNTIIQYYDQKWNPSSKKVTNGYYRKLINTTPEGYFIVQDFYTKNNLKQSSPFTITEVTNLLSHSENSINGPLVLWYQNGQQSSEQTFVNGKKQGQYQFWYDNGDKQATGSFEDGLLNDVNTVWYPNLKKQATGSFIKGKKDGVWRYWHENGQLATEEHYKLGIPVGDFRKFYGTDKPEISGQFNDNGKKVGNWTYWYENGQQAITDSYDNGLLSGASKTWHENGQLESEGSYGNDKETGTWTYWSKNGTKIIEVQYNSGLLDGQSQTWYENGNPESKGSYIAGMQNGVWTFWFDNGQKYAEGVFKDDAPSGIWTSWTKEGLKHEEISYENGKVISKKILNKAISQDNDLVITAPNIPEKRHALPNETDINNSH